MPVYRIALKSADDGGMNSERNGLLTEIVRRRYTLEFWAYSDTYRETSVTICNSVLLPQIGDTFAIWTDSDTLATCVSSHAKRTGNPYVWLVVCEYDTDRIVASITDDPLTQPPDISYGVSIIERPAMRDVDGRLIQNSAGELYDPPLIRPERRQTVTIVENSLLFDAEQGRDFTEAINDAAFNGFPALTVKVLARSGHTLYSYGMQYYQITTTLEIAKIPYYEYVLDQGWRNASKQLFRDPLDPSVLPGRPTLMNGRGDKLTVATATLDAAFNIGATGFTINDQVAKLAKFPRFPTFDGGGLIVPPYNYWYVKIDDEIVKVTELTGGLVISCDRAQWGTTEANHAINAVVTLQPYFMIWLNNEKRDLTELGLPAF